MICNKISIIFGFAILMSVGSSAQASTLLYNQNFENPTGFVNDGGDINLFNSVNQLYGNQPSGFSFSQQNTVETLLITGNQAFGTGYSDPSGKGGNYALGMLSGYDLLGLSFNVGDKDFLNFRLDISSIDLSVFGGPFVPPRIIPKFEFTLYDNPTGANGLGSGTILSTFQASGTASARDVFDWTEVLAVLDSSGATNGNVTLRIELLDGGYAAMDNFRIVASDIPGDVSTPEHSSTLSFLSIGIVGAALTFKRQLKSSKFTKVS